MISVLIETRNDEAELAHTLASLVPGAVEGVVREVIVCDRGSTDGTASVAEQAGMTHANIYRYFASKQVKLILLHSINACAFHSVWELVA